MPKRVLIPVVASWLLVVLLSPLASAVSSERLGEDEYRLKAALMYKIVKYIEWPKERSPQGRASWVVGVYGKDPFRGGLEEVFAGKIHEGRPFKIRRTSDLARIGQCHLLFVPKGEKKHLERIAKALEGKGVLLLGESPDFAIGGGVINITRADNRLGFEINPDAAKREKLVISSSLLKLAKIVKDPQEL